MISVIVPVYNVEKYLRQCLDSILNQTYSDLEIILVDDGSKDGSGAICDEYAARNDRFKVIHKENGGQSSARNAGMEIFSGEYVGFVDSDDTLAPDMFSSLFDAIKNHDIAICGHNVVYGEGGKTESCVSGDKTMSSDELWEEIFGNLNNSVWNKLYKSELVRDLRFDAGFIHGEDLLFNIYYLERAKSGVMINKPLYNYYKRGDSITTGKFTRRKLMEINSKEEALRIIKESYPPMITTAQKYCFRARMNVMRAIYRAREEKNYQAELKEYERYIADNYSSIKKELRPKERIEVILFRHCKTLYKQIAKHL